MSRVLGSAMLVLAFAVPVDAAPRLEKYSSVAQDRRGKTAYQEEHEVVFDDQRVQKATTKYLDSNGAVIGEMTSDFTKMVTIPDYDYKDTRTGSSHGVRVNGEKITLWSMGEDGKRAESAFSASDFSEDTLIVSCQGLHYYLIENLDLVKAKKTIPIAYFIPGKLDYYKFTLKVDREDDAYIYFKLSIDNVFLRLFVSSLDLKYSKADRRLARFAGLSNIPDAKNEMQNVVIEYTYDGGDR